jgi:electron transfer flavoprotein beta subunit
MNIVVPIKQIPSLVDELELNSDGNGLDEDSLTFVVNEFDEHAIEQAVLIKEAGGGTVTVVGIDTTEEMEGALHTALAKGADKVVKIAYDYAPELASSIQAKIFANAISGMDADLILTGVQAADDRAGNIGPMLAAHLDMPYVGVVADIRVRDGKATIHKEYSGGIVAEFEVTLPVVVGIQAAAQPPRYAPISKIRQMAKEADVEELDADDGGASAGSAVSKMYPPESGGGAERLGDNAGEVVEKIYELLSERGLI